MKNKIVNKLLVVVFFITNTLTVLAEPLPPAPSGFPFNPNGADDEPAGANIDQAVIWLLIAGIIGAFYLLQKYREAKS
ncbi:MAG: hypothetical protein WCY89_09505 [Flavobacteriaceae bacterium]